LSNSASDQEILYLVLVRHSRPVIDPTRPAREWVLNDEGRRRCQPLAERLRAYDLDVIVTSREPKAVETGEIVARLLGIPCRAADNLHEQARETAPFFGTRAEFVAAVSTFFARPADLVLGEETALQAQERFSGAVASLLADHPQENIAVVTHGTVLSLLASQYTGQEAFPFWQRLGMPALTAFSRPEMRLLAQVDEIA